MTSFEGQVEVLGKQRRLGYLGAVEHEGKEVEPSALTINGLTMVEAEEVISRLHGPTIVTALKEESKAASREITPEMEQRKIQPKVSAEPAPKPEPAVEPVKGDPEDEPAWMQGLDVDMLSKQDKLRPVIEHMIEKGIKTPDAIVKACVQLKDKVPALKAVDAKGGFEKRMERSASIVLSGDKAS